MAGILSKPKMPPAPKVIPMADPMTTAAAKRKSVIDQQSRKGRQNTVLSQGDRLGG
jgi:hypothetical protein